MDDDQAYRRLIDWSRLPCSSLEIEIGSASGHFLVDRANRYPSSLFIGVEVAPFWHARALRNVRNAKHNNLHFALGDAGELLPLFDDERADAIHCYFLTISYVDESGETRELFVRDFAAEVHRVLRPGGRLLLLTDQEELFLAAVWAFREFSFWSSDFEPLYDDLEDGMLADTPYERRYRPIAPIFALHMTK